ncbi:MAG: YidC/Oxa1 family membrane protein insertase [Oscillospiraceae bacterium]|nr:YidC/Oxa1 family membrane protein insertase [Oscillospiraceae bacterium]
MSQLGYYICIPFAWLMRLFYSVTQSYGLAIILFTLVVKLVLLPFQLKSKKSMLRMNRMQDRVKEIQTRYANNKQRQQEEISELYAKEGINPMSGCLWSLIPFPILIALYNIIRQPLRYFMMLSAETLDNIREMATGMGWELTGNKAYEQIGLAKFIHENWGSFDGQFKGLINLDYNFLGLDLSEIANTKFDIFPGGGWPVWGLLLLPLIAAGTQMVLSVISMKASPSNGGTGKGMMYMMPLMTVIWGMMFPAALCVYWIANAGFQTVQELILNKKINGILDREETDKEREKREKRYAKYQKQKEMLAQQQERYGSRNQQPQGSKKKPQPQRKDSGHSGQSTNENGRVGQRPYARGRSFSEDHYKDD